MIKCYQRFRLIRCTKCFNTFHSVSALARSSFAFILHFRHKVCRWMRLPLATCVCVLVCYLLFDIPNILYSFTILPYHSFHLLDVTHRILFNWLLHSALPFVHHFWQSESFCGCVAVSNPCRMHCVVYTIHLLETVNFRFSDLLSEAANVYLLFSHLPSLPLHNSTYRLDTSKGWSELYVGKYQHSIIAFFVIDLSRNGVEWNWWKKRKEK